MSQPAARGAGLVRVLDEWQALHAAMRAFFAARDVREVVTPQLYPATAAQPGLASFLVSDRPPAYLQTSPEFPMKRLLAAGSGAIYQIAHAFRAGERGARHRPEFQLLEWYRPDMSLPALQDELLALLGALGFAWPVRRHEFRDCFKAHCGLDPFLAEDEALIELARSRLDFRARLDRGDLLDLLFSALAEPVLDPRQLHLVQHFPVELCENAACAQRGDVEVALRFELYMGGMELANGCDELRDADEFRRRHELDNQARLARGLPAVAPDEALLAVLEQMPPCAGIALGLDRLMMLRLGVGDISEVSPLELAQ